MTGCRVGDWVQLYSGRPWWPLDVRVGDFPTEDLVHALSIEPRFGSMSVEPYNVGDHCLRVRELVERVERGLAEARGDAPPLLTEYEAATLYLSALLHDVAEAVVRDIPRPLKYSPMFAEYRALEERVRVTIFAQFGLPAALPDIVKWADEVMLATERRDLMKPSEFDWNLREPPLVQRIVPRDWRTVKTLLGAEIDRLQAIRVAKAPRGLTVGEVAS